MAIDATSESRRSTSACIASSATGSVGGPRRTAGVVPAMCMSSARRGVPPPPPGDRSAAAPRRDDRRPGAPAPLRNGRLDILAANRLGYALYSEVFTDRCPRAARNSASGGQRTTSASTAPGSNDSITSSSATSTSRSRRWNCRPTRA